MSAPLIGLLDCNNFFVSCERLFRPDLVGKPVIVLSSNDGCVVARSQEVKDIGVLMGVPYFQIKDIVKKHHITTFSSHFALYRDLSRRVMNVMREELENVEQYSIDEAFFYIEGDVETKAKELKMKVEKRVGIPVSVGVAKTKTQAKYANSLAKKGVGVKVLDDDLWRQLSGEIPLVDIWGVGGKMELRYKRHGLVTVSDLTAADPARVDRLFGVCGLRLQQELRGVPAFPLHDHIEQQKSIMSSRTFHTSTTDIQVVADALAYHVRHAVADLRAMKHKAKLLRIFVSPSRHGDFFMRGAVNEAVLLHPSNDTIEFTELAERLLSEVFEPGVPYQKAGVQLGEFSPGSVDQLGLFSASERTSHNELMTVIDDLNHKAGREAILIGSRLRASDWQAKAEVRSPAYTTRWSDIASVKAK